MGDALAPRSRRHGVLIGARSLFHLWTQLLGNGASDQLAHHITCNDATHPPSGLVKLVSLPTLIKSTIVSGTFARANF